MAFHLSPDCSSDHFNTLCGGLPSPMKVAVPAGDRDEDEMALRKLYQGFCKGLPMSEMIPDCSRYALPPGLGARRPCADMSHGDVACSIPWPSKLAQLPWASGAGDVPSCAPPLSIGSLASSTGDWSRRTSTGDASWTNSTGDASWTSSSGDVSGEDSDAFPDWVTTLIVSNIPPRSSPEELLTAWPCSRGDYNFLYVPYSAKRHRPSGFVFINFVSNAAAARFRQEWNGRRLYKAGTGIGRELVVSISGVQGFEENMRHFARTAFATGKKCIPVVLDAQGSRMSPARVVSMLKSFSPARSEGAECGSAPRTARAA